MNAPRTSPGPLPSWFLWAGATSLSLALGLPSSTYLVSNLMRPLGPVLWGLLNVFTIGAVSGLVLGLLQFAALGRGSVPFFRWILATLLGLGLGYVISAVAGEALGSILEPAEDALAGEAVTLALFSQVLILPIALAQWWVLRPFVPRLRGWLIASLVGALLGTLTVSTLLGLLEVPLLSGSPPAVVGAALGLFTGIFQGLIFRSQRN